MSTTVPVSARNHKLNMDYVVTVARDMASLISLGLLLLFIHELATPFWRGFHCDDDTIRYPHKESTVSSSVCYFVGSGINVVLILVFEYHLLSNEAQSTASSSSSREQQNNGFTMKLYIRNVYCRLVIWLFGAISSELLTDISKFTAGRLRPHFINVCDPQVKVPDQLKTVPWQEYCLEPNNRYQYITDYECRGNPSRQRDTRLSFMSGHSSYSAYSAAHATFYLQSVMEVAKFGLFKPAIQVLIISTAFYTGLTRVSDYKHHWQDVLTGLSQGTLVAAIACWYMWPAFYKVYSKYSNNLSSRIKVDQMDHELNRVSY